MMEFLSPVWPPTTGGGPARRRPTTLSGATVALVDDNLDPAFTTQLELLLTERLGAKVRRLVKPSGTAPAPAAVIEQAAVYDLAVVGIGL
jgi:hypothetical protein